MNYHVFEEGVRAMSDKRTGKKKKKLRPPVSDTPLISGQNSPIITPQKTKRPSKV
jgi:hypothetical protein